MKTNIARIPVAKTFCLQCSGNIRKSLQQLNGITNVYTYKEDALVVFNFIRPRQLSNALNVLTDLGFPEKGEKTNSLGLGPIPNSGFQGP